MQTSQQLCQKRHRIDTKVPNDVNFETYSLAFWFHAKISLHLPVQIGLLILSNLPEHYPSICSSVMANAREILCTRVCDTLYTYRNV